MKKLWENSKTFEIIFAIVLIGIFLRFIFLGAASIRGDEGGTIWLAKQSLSQLWFQLYRDTQPPFFYALLHFWLKLGSGEFFIRSLSALLGVLTIPAVFLLGKKLFNKDVGIFAALIFAVSQANIRYAQFTRGYSLLVLLVTLSLYFFVSYLKSGKRSNLAFSIFLLVLSLYTHYFAGFLVISLNIFIVLYNAKYRKLLKDWILSQLALILTVLPLTSLFLKQILIKTIIEPSLTVSDPLTKLSLTSFGTENLFLRMFMILYHLCVGYLKVNFSNTTFLTIFIVILLTFVIIFYKSLQTLYKEEKEKAYFLVLPIALTLILLAIIWYTGIIVQYTYSRYLLFLSPLLYILIAKGVTSIKFRIAKIDFKFILLFLVVFFNIITLSSYYTQEYHKEDWKNTVQFINENSKSGDIILLYPGSYIFNINYYYTGNAKIYSLPNNLDVSKDKIFFPEVYRNIDLITPENSCNFMELTEKNNVKGVWFIHGNPAFQDKENLIKKCLDANYMLKTKIKGIDFVIYYYKA